MPWPGGGCNKLYVSADVYTGSFVQGDHGGYLSSWGETIHILDANANVVSWRILTGAPTDQQRYRSVTEVMYHPKYPSVGSPHTDEDFESLL